jgi:hypothetical protein
MSAQQMLNLLEKYRLWIIAGAVAILATIDGIQPVYFSEFQVFGAAGRRLLSGEAMNVFDAAPLQIGPIHVLLNGMADLVADIFVVDPQVVLAIAVEVGFTVGLVLVARKVAAIAGTRVNPVVEVGAIALGVAFAIPWSLYLFGHFGEGTIPLLWMLAGYEARRGRYLRAGLFLGAAAGLEPWGLWGLPLLGLGSEVRGMLKATGIAVSAAALVYAPFMLFGDFRLFGYRTVAASETALVRLLAGPEGDFSWALRGVQAALMLAVGTGLVVLARKRASLDQAIWAIPLAMGGARLLLDPVGHFFQWVPFQTAALVALIVLISSGRKPVALALAAATYPLFLEPSTGFLGLWAIGLGALACALPVVSERAAGAQLAFDLEPPLPALTTPV